MKRWKVYKKVKCPECDVWCWVSVHTDCFHAGPHESPVLMLSA